MSTTITWHPDDANMMSYAAGTLAEPLAAAVATHAAMCPRCRRELSDLFAFGGALMAELSSIERIGSVIARPPAPPEDGSNHLAQQAASAEAAPSRPLPGPVGHKHAIDLRAVPWRRLGPGVQHFRLPLSAGSTGDLRLLRIAPGRRMPEHGHGGSEMTLVLEGAYRDETGVFRCGDIQDVDGTLEHQPIVEKDGPCICLVAAEHPARFKGIVSRLLQPWTGM